MTRTKLCSKCHKEKASSDNLCKSCRREVNLQRGHGIGKEQYRVLLEAQNSCCAICGKHKSELKRVLAVDHSHETDIIRGLLCDRCNVDLGVYENRKEEFKRYLRSVPKRMFKIYKEWLNDKSTQ